MIQEIYKNAPTNFIYIWRLLTYYWFIPLVDMLSELLDGKFKKIPENKTSREIFEYFFKFWDMFSIKIAALVTYYNQEDAEKAIEETNVKKKG